MLCFAIYNASDIILYTFFALYPYCLRDFNKMKER